MALSRAWADPRPGSDLIAVGLALPKGALRCPDAFLGMAQAPRVKRSDMKKPLDQCGWSGSLIGADYFSTKARSIR